MKLLHLKLASFVFLGLILSLPALAPTVTGQTTAPPQKKAPLEATPPATENPKTQQPADLQSESKSKPPFATGIVFSDVDGNGAYGPNDQPFSGVKVSNGIDIVETDKNGRYELSLAEDSVLFLIKPSGYRTALDQQNLPEFYYIHKPNGSPKLKFPGSEPTGPLPQSIDFPMYEQSEPDSFRMILFGDPQPRNHQEVDYISHDVISELIGNPLGAAFGVSLGDLAFDNLDTFEALNQTVALVGIPWYNVIGNHDINLDASTRRHINETFERTYGPSYYSFDYGQVHFVVLDNIDWVKANDQIKHPHFGAAFGQRQLDFLKKDLALIPESQMVVLMMHVPITGTQDKQRLFDLIEKRPLCISISGHTHYHEHLFLGPDKGFNGPKKHHHIINVTVSGSWWSGLKDDRGIPHAGMADGAPNGYSILTFDGEDYHLDFKAAGRPAAEQMKIHLAHEISSTKTADAEVWVNVYNGSEKSTVEMAVDDSGDWTRMKQTRATDPGYVKLFESESKFNPAVHPKYAKPIKSSHLWMGKLPADLPPGTHLLRVRTTDMHQRTYQGHRSFRVTE